MMKREGGIVSQLKPKVCLSSFDVTVLTGELNAKLQGYYIDKIYQVSPLTILIKLNKPASPKIQLVVAAGKSMHTTRYEVEKPVKPSGFSLALRKHLLNGRIQAIRQPDFERITIIDVSKGEKIFRLLAELFGKGNLILTDGEERILQALSYRRMRDREIIRGEILELPPPIGIDPRKIVLEELSARLGESKGTVVKVLTSILGIGGIYAEEILIYAGVEKTVNCTELEPETIEQIYRATKEIFTQIENPKPQIVMDEDGSLLDITPFPLQAYSGKPHKPCPTMDEALDFYFTKKVFEEEEGKQQGRSAQKLEEQSRIAREQSAKLKKLGEERGENRRGGELIFKCVGELTQLTLWIHKKREMKMGWREIEAEALSKSSANEFPFQSFRSIDPKDPSMKISLEGIDLNLNLNETVHRNASILYDRAKSVEAKIASLKEAMTETSRKMEDLKGKFDTAKKELKEPVKVQEKKWFEKYRFFHSSESFLVVAGKDASSSEALIKRYTEPQDIVFHADVIGAPFTVIKTGGKTPPETTIQEAAQFAACYSRAWREGHTVVDVYYVKPDQLSKTAPSGEYLGRGSFMVRGQRSYLHNVTLSLGVGVKFDGGVEVVAGPVSTVKKSTPIYVTLSPGDESTKEISVKIRRSILEKLPAKLKVEFSKTQLDLSAIIPFGKAKLVSEKHL
jgi:predicted ribosome quality control (RQC) complex YloA/Tae2 family protein